jgi:hypothetical protein
VDGLGPFIENDQVNILAGLRRREGTRASDDAREGKTGAYTFVAPYFDFA